MSRRKLPRSIATPSRWRRSWPATAVIVIVAALAAYDRLPRRSSAKGGAAPSNIVADDLRRYHDQEFAVARVIDGDTFDIDMPDGDQPATRVRLWGVDCPEPGHTGGQGMHYGREAAEFARQALQGRSVHALLSPKQTRDRHGRLLAYVFLDRGGVMFNEELIERGFACADRRFPHHYSERFEAAERRAKREKLGLWRNLVPKQAPEWYQRVARSAASPRDIKTEP